MHTLQALPLYLAIPLPLAFSLSHTHNLSLPPSSLAYFLFHTLSPFLSDCGSSSTTRLICTVCSVQQPHGYAHLHFVLLILPSSRTHNLTFSLSSPPPTLLSLSLGGVARQQLHGSLNLVDLAGSERLDKSGIVMCMYSCTYTLSRVRIYVHGILASMKCFVYGVGISLLCCVYCMYLRTLDCYMFVCMYMNTFMRNCVLRRQSAHTHILLLVWAYTYFITVSAHI